jgi:hypothetical protein
VASRGREAGLNVALHVLHYHDGVIHHDADGQHHAEQGQGVDGVAKAEHQREGADDGHRHRQQRDDGRAPGLQEDDDHQHHQGDGLQQGGDHRLDAGPYELGRVIDDAVLHRGRKVLGQFGHGLAYLLRNVQCVGARRLEDGNGHGGLVVEQGAQAIFGGGQLDAGHVAQAGDAAIGGGLEDDLRELRLVLQAALGVHVELQGRAAVVGRRADHAGGHLYVLLADGLDDLGGGQAALCDLTRVQPHAHGVVARTEQAHLAHALDARQTVLDVEDRVVAQVGHVIAVIRRGEVHHHGDGGRALGGGHTQALHVLR